MSEKITEVQRWLDLIAFLLGRRMPANEVLSPSESYLFGHPAPAYARLGGK